MKSGGEEFDRERKNPSNFLANLDHLKNNLIKIVLLKKESISVAKKPTSQHLYNANLSIS